MFSLVSFMKQIKSGSNGPQAVLPSPQKLVFYVWLQFKDSFFPSEMPPSINCLLGTPHLVCANKLEIFGHVSKVFKDHCSIVYIDHGQLIRSII